MRRLSFGRLGICLALLFMMLTAFTLLPPAVLAQDAPVADTPTPEPATFTPTATVQPATSTPTPQDPTATPTGQVATATAVVTVTPQPPKVVPIPEPVTVVLFGTGLAALSAAIATRRNKNGKR